jgi:nitrogen-specific signal transduction histidine kinase
VSATAGTNRDPVQPLASATDTAAGLALLALQQTEKPILVADQDGSPVVGSAGFCRLLGASLADLRRGPAAHFCWQPDRWASSASAYLAKGGTCECVQSLPRADGASIPVRVSCRAMGGGPDGSRVLGYVCFYTDLREELRLEEERTRLQNQMLRSQKAESVGRLAGGVAHNFNNALAGIIGVASLAKTSHPDDVQLTADLDAILGQARRMAGWTKRLLAFARQGKHEPASCDINEVIRGVVDLLRPSMGASYRLATELAEDLPLVTADVAQFQEVCEQIIINAAEAAGDNGSTTVSTGMGPLPSGLQPPVDSEQWLRVSFADDGPGISADVLPNVFDPFFSTRFPGRGLGLAMAKGVIENHDGLITVQSERGKGTRFDIYLPVRAAARTQAATSTPAVSVSGRTVSDEKRETVLVIDDEEVLSKMLAQYFGMNGYHVLVANSGTEALQLLADPACRPDLCIMDMVLPDFLGGELYAHLRYLRPSLRVLICSAYPSDGPVQDVLEAGACGFVQKPFSLQSMGEQARRIIDGR